MINKKLGENEETKAECEGHRKTKKVVQKTERMRKIERERGKINKNMVMEKMIKIDLNHRNG